MSLYKDYGENKVGELLYDVRGTEKIGVPLTPGQGTIARGTVIYRASTGMWNAAAAGDVVNTNMLAVLNTETDTDADKTISEDADAYRQGRFIDGKVTLKDAAELSDDNKVVLAYQGITFGREIENDTFNNTTGE